MGTGVGEAMLIGAATGGGMSAVTGGDPLKGALLGAAGGGLGAGVAGAQAGAASGSAGAAGGAPISTANLASPDKIISSSPATVTLPGAAGDVSLATAYRGAPLMDTAGQMAGSGQAAVANNPMFPKIAEFAAKNPMMMPAGLGAMGATVGGALNPAMPGKPKYSGPLSRFKYDPNKYKRQMATGGLADTSVAKRMMSSGGLGSYSDGGRLLKRPKDGDGMTDNIPAKIGDKQPARLADGEFVIPADVVSGIGNGSTDAGARKLYAMLDRVREARTGTRKQGREIKAEKYLPT